VRRRGKHHKDYNLLSSFFKHVKCNAPRAFLLENVPQLASDETFQENVEELTREGYSIRGDVVRYSNFGAPTRRRRFIVFGIREGDADDFFLKLPEFARSPKTVEDVIWKLRNLERGEIPDHVWPEMKTIDKYRHYYETGKYGWYVLKWKKPAPSFGNVTKTYILHPDAFDGGIKRVISVREALLIMGFDEDFRFPPNAGLGSRYQMIVDAVSPVFSRAAATVVKEILPN
jgi:DNA (cytosine-5)-methyltransferase 1